MAGTAKTTKKPTAKGKSAARKGTEARQTAPDGGIAREAWGVGLFCLGLLLLFFLITDPETGVGQAVVTVARGLAGALSFVLPVCLCWAGVTAAFSGRERAARPGRILLVTVLILLVMTLVHVFSADEVMKGARLYNYENFLQHSYNYQFGGAGLLGALLCWPLYRGLGAAGAAMVLVALILVNLILQRKISLRKIGHEAAARYDEFKERQQARATERMQRREAAQAASQTVPKAGPRADEMDDPFARYLGDSAKPRKSREMRVEKIDESMPGEPRPQAAPEPAETVDDIPEYLGGRRKPRVRAEKLHIEEPKGLPRYDPPEPEPQPAPEPDGSEIAEKPPRRGKADVLPGQDEWIVPPSNRRAAGQRADSGADIRFDRFMDDEAPASEPEPDGLPGDPEGDVVIEPDDGDVPDIRDIPVQGVSELGEDEPLTGEVAIDGQPPFDLPFDMPKKRPVAFGAVSRTPLYPVAKPVKADEKPEKPEKNVDSEDAAEEEPYTYPPFDLLAPAKPAAVRNQAEKDREKGQKLVETLASFGIETYLVAIAHGPTITRFELKPAAGIKVSRITALSDDIALNLAAISVRIEAPIPGKSAVGVEVPNDTIETVPLREVLESAECKANPSRLAVALGRDNAGRNIIADLSKMPHTLVAGQTGSGKSVCVNCIICSILYRASPAEVRLILIDPKVVELQCYNGVPHLLVPVVTDPKKAAGALDWAVSEMTSRYKQFAAAGVRNIKGFNQHRAEGEPQMPQIVIIIDELADLMMVTPAEVEDSICRLAQLARAAGIHLVVATQRPSVNIITGDIKANIPSRIAFQTASQIDSRTILDSSGAEKLLGRGDMIYAPSGGGKTRVQGAWVSDDEVQSIVDFLKVRHDASYDEDVLEQLDAAEMSDADRENKLSEFDELLPQAVELVVESEQASVSLLQRRLRVGHSRAGRLIDEMEVRGIVGPDEGSKARKVLMSREQFRAQYKN